MAAARADAGTHGDDVERVGHPERFPQRGPADLQRLAQGAFARQSVVRPQAAIAARPTHAELAAALTERLDCFPADSGLPSLEPVAEKAPAHLVAKIARALAAPIEELVVRNVITSADVLATVLPQITAHLLAANFDNEQLSTLYAQAYAACCCST